MSSFVAHEKFRRPQISFTEGLKKAAGGLYYERGDGVPWLYRALVIAADSKGGRLETPDGKPAATPNGSAVTELEVNVQAPVKTLGIRTTLGTYTVTPTRGPINPPNSIRARILSGDKDKMIDDDNLRTYWPLFPSAQLPDAGEMVYVVFEDENFQHGLWLGRIANNSRTPDGEWIGENQYLQSEMMKNADDTRISQIFSDLATPVTSSSGQILPRGFDLTSLFIDRGRR